MYYLTKRNTIINSNNTVIERYKKLRDRGDIEFPLMNEEDIVTKFIGEIKIKGENVFDLIEVGDLVKFTWNNRNDNCPISIRKVYSIKKHKDNDWLTVDYELAIYDDEVLAIYKLNKNGDYIKVWEKENENEK